MQLKDLRFFGIIALCFLFSNAHANVSLKNGNFFIGYNDISYPGGIQPKIERVFNSKSAYAGIFGPGWGSEYESYLKVSADGSVVVYEYGGGAENRFNPVNFSGKELESAIERISQANRVNIGNADSIAKYKAKLRTDASFRNEEWQKLVQQKKIAPRNLAVNTQLISNRFSYQYLVKIANGYQRVFDTGKVETYNNLGQLAKIADKNGNSLLFSYSSTGKLEKLLDNQNRKMFLKVDSKGRLMRVDGEGGRFAEYKYNDQGELSYSKDVEGNTYRYEYSNDKLHNITKVTYDDKTTLEVSYYDKSSNYSVKSLKSREGLLTEYSYKNMFPGSQNYAVSLVVKDKDRKKISDSSYEYQLKTKPNGEEYTYRLITSLDGERTETTYNECCGLPILIKKGTELTQFKYDVKGRVLEKDTPNEMTLLKYHPKFSKVVEVKKVSKRGTKSVRWSQFEYDNNANLKKAKNSDKKTVVLLYDPQGRIKTLVDQAKRQISFKYNDASKPVEITDPKLGSIKVTYTNAGEVKNVDSPAGRKIAVEVSSAFQNLMDIIRPAGVTLSF